LRLNVGCGGGSYGFKDFRCELKIDIEAPQERIDNFIQADAQHLPLVDSCLTEIYSRNMMEHLENPMSFLGECYRCLKEESVLHLWVPNFLSINAIHPEHLQIYNIFRLRKELRYFGFRIKPLFSAGSRLPKLIRRPIHTLFHFLCEEFNFEAQKGALTR